MHPDLTRMDELPCGCCLPGSTSQLDSSALVLLLPTHTIHGLSFPYCLGQLTVGKEILNIMSFYNK